MPSWTSWPTISPASNAIRSSRRSSRARSRRGFPTRAPESPEPLDTILADYVRLVEPNATHWQHPGFMAYFATTASGPGILGEMLTAALGQNPMLWRTSPIGTELEGVVVGWLRDGLGLPASFDGLLTDTASTSTLIALGAAREALGLGAAARGPARPEDVPAAPRLRLGARPQLHRQGVHDPGPRPCVRRPRRSRRGLRDAARGPGRCHRRRPCRRAPADGHRRDDRDDLVHGDRPGRRRSRPIAEREGLWLHVDAAYAGPVALIPERRDAFDGWERADSIVLNPHKWLFTPLDASLLLTRRMDDLRAAFSLVPEYLRTLDREAPVRDYNEYTPQLGRRFRALKLWVQLRWFGLEGLRRRIERHIEMAEAFAGWVDADPDWERLAPGPVLDGLLPVAPGRTRADDATALDDGQRRGSWTPSIGRARCSCRTPGSMIGSRSGCRSGTFGPSRVTWSAPGRCCARRPPR